MEFLGSVSASFMESEICGNFNLQWKTDVRLCKVYEVHVGFSNASNFLKQICLSIVSYQQKPAVSDD